MKCEVWEWISNLISHFAEHVIFYPVFSSEELSRDTIYGILSPTMSRKVYASCVMAF